MNSPLLTSPQYLKGIGPKRAQLLENAGIKNIEDVLYYFPRRYQDRTHIIPISKLYIGQLCTVAAEVLTSGAKRSYWRRGLDIFEISVADDTGRLFVVWFNQPYLRNYVTEGKKVVLYGRVELYKDRIQMSNPEFEFIEEGDPDADVAKIVPVYSLPQGFSQRVFRKIVRGVLDKYLSHVVEVLPFDVRSRHALDNIAKSLLNIHFPESEASRLAAYRRLSFEEFFVYQVPLIMRKLKRKEKKGIAFRVDEKLACDFIASLSFVLTDAQKRIFEEIKADMCVARPMQRLLQGDVGSGKTIVAVLAALVAVSNGYQVVVMVPTEILANQHFEKIGQQVAGIRQQKKIKIVLLTSSLKEDEKKEALHAIVNGDADIVIGTHAVIQENVKFRKLGLIVIDEQHKFGVSQRALLSQKAVNPDVLIMTATPIPRTLCMTLYGDLDVSVLDELPKGRKNIKTTFCSFEQKQAAYDFLKSQVKEGRQAYVVYPLIEENPKLELASAKSMFKEFSQDIFKEFKVGLIHGKLSRKEQDKVMARFRKGAVDILVATTILEVGIDVPNASVMIIEHAERFGLSQLHQMRGRIGRGPHESFCLLIADPHTEDAQARVDVLTASSDGFRIAEEDLKIRGPGEFFGERQHGLTELKIADPLKQMHLLKDSREEVIKLVTNDPKLDKRLNQELKKQLYRRFPEFEKFMMVG